MRCVPCVVGVLLVNSIKLDAPYSKLGLAKAIELFMSLSTKFRCIIQHAGFAGALSMYNIGRYYM